MQYDICLKTTSEAALIAALAPFGLTSQGEAGNAVILTASHDHALAYVGRVQATPPVIDPETMAVTTDAAYLDGEYAVLRAEEAILDRIAGATMDGVDVLTEPPAGCPTFGEWRMRPAQPTVAQRIAEAVAARTLEAAAAMQTALDPLAARFPDHETKTWPEQLAEAKAILDGEGDPEPTIEKYPAIGNIIAETGESWVDFAMAVKANNAAWTAITCNVAGQRQKFVAAIKTAAAAPGATVADVLAVPLAITLPT